MVCFSGFFLAANRVREFASKKAKQNAKAVAAFACFFCKANELGQVKLRRKAERNFLKNGFFQVAGKKGYKYRCSLFSDGELRYLYRRKKALPVPRLLGCLKMSEVYGWLARY